MKTDLTQELNTDTENYNQTKKAFLAATRKPDKIKVLNLFGIFPEGMSGYPMWKLGPFDIIPNKPVKLSNTELSTEEKVRLLIKYSASREDGFRPVLMGVYHGSDGDLVSTDGHQLIILKNSSDRSGKVRDVDGDVIDAQYPDYQRILPQPPLKTIGSYGLDRFTDILNTTNKIGRGMDFEVKIGEQSFKTPLINRITEVLRQLGVDKVLIVGTEQENSVIQLSGFSFGKVVKALVMPLRRKDVYYEEDFNFVL